MESIIVNHKSEELLNEWRCWTVSFENDFDVTGGLETEQVLKEKGWYVQWESELYKIQVHGI